MRERREVHHSRLDHDPVPMGKAVLLSSLISLLITFGLFPPASRHDSAEEITRRFGYPGPTHFEREIRVRVFDQSPSDLAPNRLMGGLRQDAGASDVGAPVPQARPRGKSNHPRQFPGLDGLAESGLDRSRSLRHLNLPTVQSEDLIILELVRPEYPRQAVEQGLAGHVELLALVNERGTVDDVELVQSAGPLLDAAAELAVRRCRFAPYRVDGRAQSVYANFRFNFTLVGDADRYRLTPR
jgi:protein TonB